MVAPFTYFEVGVVRRRKFETGFGQQIPIGTMRLRQMFVNQAVNPVEFPGACDT